MSQALPAIRHHTVQVPATSANLGAGYDAFGLALELHLAVRTLPRDEQIDRVQSVGEHAAGLATGDDNLIWRSFVAFCTHHAVPVPDVALRVASRIPLERGLGSSSAAIVAGLVLARALTGAVVGDRELVVLASDLEGHPDNVAPALLGGLVACTTTDDGELVVRRVNPTPRLRPLALVPDHRQATTAARAVVPEQLAAADVAVQAGRAGHVLAALVGAWPADPRVAGDRLHEPPRLEVMGPTGAVVAALRAAGVHAWLSGAGPSVAAAVGAGAGGGAAAVGAGAGGGADATAEARRIAREHGFTLLETAFDLRGAMACPDDGCAIAGTGGCLQCPRRLV